MADQTSTHSIAAPVRQTAPPPRWTAGRIAMIVAGSLVALVALCLIAGGAYGLWLHTTQRSDGYVMTSSERFATGTYALATRTLHISSDVPGFLYGRDWLGDGLVDEPRAAASVPLLRMDGHDARLDEHAEVGADGVDVQSDGERELARVQRLLRRAQALQDPGAGRVSEGPMEARVGLHVVDFRPRWW